jgi:hypothetical protein
VNGWFGDLIFVLTALHLQVPAQFVCRETADEIAMAAYNRALKLSMPGTETLFSFSDDV